MVSRACRPCPLPFVRGSRISYMIPFQELHREGIGVEIKHAPITSGDEEIILWEWQILGCHLPTALNEGYFFLNGNNFCLRSGKEYRISRFHNFRQRMTTGSTPSMGLGISVEVLLTYIKRIKWFSSLFVPLLESQWRPLPCEIA